MKKFIVGVAAVLMATALVSPTPAGASNAFSADCNLGGASSFTATRSGMYSWVWRTGTTVNGVGSQYLTVGTVMMTATPGAATGSTRFGVVSTRGSYSYVTCD